jgi:hypothetical protein
MLDPSSSPSAKPSSKAIRHCCALIWRPVRLHLIANVDVECERAVLEAVAAGFLRTLLAMLPWQPTNP